MSPFRTSSPRGVGPRSPKRSDGRGAAPSRRGFLRGVLQGSAIFVGLPMLEAMLNGNGTALACGGAIPKRSWKRAQPTIPLMIRVRNKTLVRSPSVVSNLAP